MRNGQSSQEIVVTSAFQQWLQQGEHLYNEALRECQEIERQIAELEARLVDKQGEANQIAQIIGKPVVDGSRRLCAQLVAAEVIYIPADRVGTPGSNANIARALTGKFGR